MWSPDGLFILFALSVCPKTTNRNLCWCYHVLQPRTLTVRLVEFFLFSFCADILFNSRHIRDISMLCTLLNFLWLNISLEKTARFRFRSNQYERDETTEAGEKTCAERC